MKYVICPNRGSNLDHGEICDCKGEKWGGGETRDTRPDQTLRSLAEDYLGQPITDEQYQSARHYAERKLNWIIGREGDADGERRKPYYLAMLIEEQVRADALTELCFLHNALLRAVDERQPQTVQPGTKKEMPVENPQSTSLTYPYCTTKKTICQ